MSRLPWGKNFDKYISACLKFLHNVELQERCQFFIKGWMVSCPIVCKTIFLSQKKKIIKSLYILFFSTLRALRFYLPWVGRSSGNQHSCLCLGASNDLRVQKILTGVSALLTVLRPALSSAKEGVVWMRIPFHMCPAGFISSILGPLHLLSFCEIRILSSG